MVPIACHWGCARRLWNSLGYHHNGSGPRGPLDWSPHNESSGQLISPTAYRGPVGFVTYLAMCELSFLLVTSKSHGSMVNVIQNTYSRSLHLTCESYGMPVVSSKIGANIISNFSIIIQIRWTFHFALTQILTKWSQQTLAHAIITVMHKSLLQYDDQEWDYSKMKFSYFFLIVMKKLLVKQVLYLSLHLS